MYTDELSIQMCIKKADSQFDVFLILTLTTDRIKIKTGVHYKRGHHEYNFMLVLLYLSIINFRYYILL